MSDREVIGRGVGGFCILVGERRVRVPNDLAETVVLHHDDEDMVQVGDAFGDAAFGGEHRTYQRCGQQTQNCGLFSHGSHLFSEESSRTLLGLGARLDKLYGRVARLRRGDREVKIR